MNFRFKSDDSSAPSPPPKRYLVLGTWYGHATPAFVDAGKAAGFNSVRVTANWGNMETSPNVINWSVLDNQTAYINDVAKLPLVFNIWCQRYHPDDVVPRAGLAVDQTGDGAVNNVTWAISFANETSVASAMRFVTAVVERYGARYADTLMFYVCFDGYSETEFFPGGATLGPGSFDFGPAAQSAFHAFLRTKYNDTAALSKVWGVPELPSFTAARPPVHDAKDDQVRGRGRRSHCHGCHSLVHQGFCYRKWWEIRERDSTALFYMYRSGNRTSTGTSRGS